MRGVSCRVHSVRSLVKTIIVVALIALVGFAGASSTTASLHKDALKIKFNYAQRQTFSPIAVLIGVKTRYAVRHVNFYVGDERLVASPLCGDVTQPCDEWQAMALAAPSDKSIKFTSEVYNRSQLHSRSLTTRVALNGTERGVVRAKKHHR